MTTAPWTVVGLGNPGTGYAGNRHNVGQMVVDVLARRDGGAFRHDRAARAQVLDVRLGTFPGGAPGPRVVLAKPTSYMNLSGGPVAAVLRAHGGSSERLLVVHDELDLPPGTLRLKRGGGEGGHNGLRSISQTLGTRDYVRLRIGIGRPPGRMDAADYVLSDFRGAEKDDVAVTIERAADVVEDVVVGGLLAAQGRWHTQEN